MASNIHTHSVSGHLLPLAHKLVEESGRVRGAQGEGFCIDKAVSYIKKRTLAHDMSYNNHLTMRSEGPATAHSRRLPDNFCCRCCQGNAEPHSVAEIYVSSPYSFKINRVCVARECYFRQEPFDELSRRHCRREAGIGLALTSFCVESGSLTRLWTSNCKIVRRRIGAT